MSSKGQSDKQTGKEAGGQGSCDGGLHARTERTAQNKGCGARGEIGGDEEEESEVREVFGSRY